MSSVLLSIGLALSSACGPVACGSPGVADTAEMALARTLEQPALHGKANAGDSDLINEALGYLGVRYRLGGASRERGVDCANLVRLVFREERGLDLPWSALQLFHEGVAVPREDLQPGDLVFFKNTYKRGISHVGLYIGGGRFVHAASRKHGVIVSDLSAPYYRAHYAGARRIVDGAGTVVAGG
jgi:cell wall-associated NlpC family hydrolase